MEKTEVLDFIAHLRITVIVGTGGIDPWKELSVMQGRTEEGEEAETIFIEDTAHCADMTSKRVTDRCSLRKAKQVLYVCLDYIIM